MRKLQVALDLISLEEALKIARDVVEGGAHILEVGTPLIKAEGVKAVEILRKKFSQTEIFADTKTMDAGAIEAELMISKGANYVSVLGVASNATIIEAVNKAHELGGKIVVDLMNVKDPIARALELAKYEVDGFCLHTGIDVRKHKGLIATSLLEYAKRIKSNLGDVLLFIAGGIRVEHLNILRNYPIDVVIVGSAITKSENPKQITQEFIKNLK